MNLSHVTALTLFFGICVPCTGAEPGGSSGMATSAQQTPSAGSHDAHEDTHKPTNVLFSTPLQDVPGTEMVVVQLELAPRGKQPAVPHRHPGSVLVYVTRGVARLGIEGQTVQEVSAGQTFFEPLGALHTVGESASETESATAIAVLLVPKGAPILTVEPKK